MMFLLKLIPSSSSSARHYRGLNGLTLVFVFPTSLYLPSTVIIVTTIDVVAIIEGELKTSVTKGFNIITVFAFLKFIFVGGPATL